MMFVLCDNVNAESIIAKSNTAALSWQKVGNTAKVTLFDNGNIRMEASEPTTAGVLSEPVTLSEKTDAILLQSQVSNAATQAVTFATHHVTTGVTTGYWQNPVAIEQPTVVTTVLRLPNDSPAFRLFLGTHGHSSYGTTISMVHWRPIHVGFVQPKSGRGMIINQEETLRQTFLATESRLAAVVIRIRELQKNNGSGPNLRVRLYDWIEGIDRSVKQPYLAETIVPRHQISGTLEGALGDFEIVATYVGGARELAVPLDAVLIPGKSYLLELAVDGPCKEHQSLLTYGDDMDGYPDGDLYKNAELFMRYKPKQWDLYMEMYYAE